MQFNLTEDGSSGYLLIQGPATVNVSLTVAAVALGYHNISMLYTNLTSSAVRPPLRPAARGGDDPLTRALA